MRGMYLAADDPPFLSTEYLLDFFRGLLDISLESIGTRVHTTSETSWHWDFSDDEVVCCLSRPSVGTDVTILEDGTVYELTTPINGVDKHSRIVASTFERPASIRNIVELGDLKDDIELVASLEGAQSLFEIPLWRAPASHIQTDIVKLLGFLEARDNDWSFWIEWLKGLLNGTPINWELQRRVALIDDAVWNAGPEAVSAEIERIKSEFSLPPTGKERFPKHEPKSVRHLFENRVVASASLQGLAAQVTQSIERFHAETGANALPEALEALAALPALLLAVNATIQAAPPDGAVASETEDQLRAEIGRLNAKVAQLENELQKACSAKPSVFSGAFKKQLGTSLGDWKLYAALCTGLWFVSGDAEGTQRRLENISLYHDMIFGEVSSPSKSAPKHPTAATESTLEI